jgi:hypothetical protein
MNAHYQRRAIFTGMRPFLRDADLKTALEIWQDKYLDKPKTAYTQFIAESCGTKELKGKRSAILNSIFNALTLPEKELLPDPFNQQTNQIEIAFIQQENHIEANLVFVHFMQSLFGHLGAEHESKVRHYLVEHCEGKFNLNMQQMLALKMWLNNVNDSFEISFSADDKRELTNLGYIAMCQYIGPVKADQVLSMSIKQTEPYAREKRVNLHAFL